MYLSGFFENIYAAFELLMILIADQKIDTRVWISHDLHKNKNTYSNIAMYMNLANIMSDLLSYCHIICFSFSIKCFVWNEWLVQFTPNQSADFLPFPVSNQPLPCKCNLYKLFFNFYGWCETEKTTVGKI